MEKLVYLNNLYDLYGILLTEKQQTYFEEYYFNNLSYGEISEKYNISRNACFKQLKIIGGKTKRNTRPYKFKNDYTVDDNKCNICYVIHCYIRRIESKYEFNAEKDIINMIDDKNLKEELENLL